MSFIQKYEKGSKTEKVELKDQPKEYVFKEPKEITENVNTPPINSTNAPFAAETKPEITPKPVNNKLTINGIDFDKNKLVSHLKNISFKATGLNRIVWDKVINKFENINEYNSSNSLNVDYSGSSKYTPEEVTERGNYILAEILGEADSSKFGYALEKSAEPKPFTINSYFGKQMGLGTDYDPKTDYSKLLSFEEDEKEVEYEKDKTGNYVPKLKNKKTVYSDRASIAKRAGFLKSYIDELLSKASADPDDTKYLSNTLTKDEWLSRLQEVKNSEHLLDRTYTLKNIAPKLQRVGINLYDYLGKEVTAQTIPTEGNDATKTAGEINTAGKTITNANGTKTTTSEVKKTDGSVEKTTTTFDKEGKVVGTPVVAVVSPSAPNQIFKVKPQGLPEHFATEDYYNYISTTLINPYAPGTTQYTNWEMNPLANPYDEKSLEYGLWNDRSKNKKILYALSVPPKDLRDNTPKQKDYVSYILDSESNPFKPSTQNYVDWEAWKNNNYSHDWWDITAIKPKQLSPYKDRWDLTATPKSNEEQMWERAMKVRALKDPKNVTIPRNKPNFSNWELYQQDLKNGRISKNVTFDEYEKARATLKKGQQGFKFDPYSSLQQQVSWINKFGHNPLKKKFTTPLEENDINQQSVLSNNYGMTQSLQDYINGSKTPKNSLASVLQKENPSKASGMSSMLDDLLNVDNLTPAIKQETKPATPWTYPFGNRAWKNNINPKTLKITPETNEETKDNFKLGSTAITWLGDALSTASALQINNKIAKDYRNSIKYQTIAPQQFASAKVYADPSRVDELMGLGNKKPITSDISSYYGAKRDFNNQVGEYLLKEQQQTASGIRQDRAKVSAIEDLRNREYAAVNRANDAAKTTFDNNLALLDANKKTKQGDILLDFIKNTTNAVAGYSDEKTEADQAPLMAKHRTKLNTISLQKVQITNDPLLTAQQKSDALAKLNEEEFVIHDAYIAELNQLNSKYWNTSKTTTKKVETRN